ncbi:MAG: hypothetical protein IJK62_03170 [Bacteroidales bacterium]|nr:hypothetical protein [Bacteroidales bacterium]
MKNFKIVMILVAAVAMFCSCGDPEAPTASILDANGMNEMTFDLANASVDVNATLTANDAKGLKSISLTRTSYDANNEVLGTPAEYDVKDYEGKTEYTAELSETLAKADVEGAAKVVYEAVVTNKKDVQVTVAYTVNVVAPSVTMTTSDLRWYRCGNTKEGMAEVGLNWDSQTKDVLANIKPIEGAKLYILEAADYAIDNIDALNAKLTTEATVYRSISATTPKTYNDVIATVYNGKTYLMNITKSTVTSETAGTAITVTGTMKTFAVATPVAAK